MAGLPAAAHHGSGHLLGHVLGDGQAVSMAANHVGSLSVYVEEMHLISEAIFSSLTSSWITDRQGSSQPLWLHEGFCISKTTNSILHSQITLTMILLVLLLFIFSFEMIN